MKKAVYIYIIKEANCNSTGFINYKVGKSGDPKKCIKDLQTCNHYKLHVDVTPVTDMNMAENALYSTLSSY